VTFDHRIADGVVCSRIAHDINMLRAEFVQMHAEEE